MTTRLQSFALLAITMAAGVATAYGCGSDDTSPVISDDGGNKDGALLDALGNGDGNGNVGDAAPVGDGSNGMCLDKGATCTKSTECCSVNCNAGKCADPIGGGGSGDGGLGGGGGGGGLNGPGQPCTSPIQCTTGICGTDGKCANTVCISDKQVCYSNASCCSGMCSKNDGTAGTCTPLSTTCLTSNNECTAGGEACCSGVCNNGVCAGQISFCRQTNDSCSTGTDCCTGVCNKAAGATLGTCAALSVPGATGCTIAGQVCSTTTSGCGGSCCSRSCGPSFAPGVSVCENPSGCHPTGEICHTDKDCCGSTELKNGDQVLSNGSGHCSKNSPSDAVGRCDNGNACRPLGAICKVPTVICQANAENNCCTGQVQENKPETWINCQQDVLGIPRCTGAGNCAGKTVGDFAGKACGSSADCCNLAPCVPNGSGGFVCGSAACVPTDSLCSNNGDCCLGNFCYIAAGATFGSCKPTPTTTPPGDGGTGGTDSGSGGTDSGITPPPVCALYGQSCASAPCCDQGVSCINGRCVVP